MLMWEPGILGMSQPNENPAKCFFFQVHETKPGEEGSRLKPKDCPSSSRSKFLARHGGAYLNF